MKIKISIAGKTTVENKLLTGTEYALIKGNELHINPEGYCKEVKIISLAEEKLPDFSYLDHLRVEANSWIPPGSAYVFRKSPFFP